MFALQKAMPVLEREQNVTMFALQKAMPVRATICKVDCLEDRGHCL
jgi:hypothetical protein